MKQKLALDYLETYNIKVAPLWENYFRVKIKESKKIGVYASELLTRFTKMAVLGKKVRGALMVLGYQIAEGRNMTSIYEASLFIELMHTGLLIHDDIMDNSDFRRGLPSLHKQYYPSHLGKSMAINAGDIAFYLSWEKLMTSDFPKDKLTLAGKIYSEYLLKVIYGQILDISKINVEHESEKVILNMLRYKTAEYTGVFPLLIGAILGGMKDLEKIDKLKKYGVSLGWAFQIQDDILGLYGNEEKTGKPVGSDLKEGKRTLFTYYVLKHGNAKQKEYILSILGNKKISKDDITKAQELLKEVGAYEYVVNLGRSYVKEGKEAIRAITSDKKLQNILRSLIKYIMERTR